MNEIGDLVIMHPDETFGLITFYRFLVLPANVLSGCIFLDPNNIRSAIIVGTMTDSFYRIYYEIIIVAKNGDLRKGFVYSQSVQT